ncbi:hypothetical protein RRG08_016820 [Elysia crispata]|uniref:Uncharacterized protein n=1 Tax=Elysia crispata TaxID=231223 RepID=A0AAE1A0H5_9GAST|nr:hypothetical protein RRG08_016820 [Elysia crispata]
MLLVDLFLYCRWPQTPTVTALWSIKHKHKWTINKKKEPRIFAESSVANHWSGVPHNAGTEAHGCVPDMDCPAATNDASSQPSKT